MTSTLFGDNNFGIKTFLNDRVGSFVKKHGDLALERIDCEESEFTQIQTALTSVPFLADKKMVVLRNPSTNKQFTEQAEQLLAEKPETTDVIIVEQKLDKRQAYYKFLLKNTDFKEFTNQDSNNLASWLVNQAKAGSYAISLADSRYLISRVGANQQLLSNELEKLGLYDAKITRQTIDLLTEPTPQSTIFQLLESAFGGNTKQALNIYREQRAMKVDPVQIIAMISWQLNVLAVIKTAGTKSPQLISKEAKINPYVLSKSQSIARKLSITETKTLIKDLLYIDVKSKTTNFDVDEALQNYILKLAV